MNGPISGLNFVLVLVATVAGFYRRAVIVTADQKRGYLADEGASLCSTREGGGSEIQQKQMTNGREETGEAADTQGFTRRIRDLRSLLRSRRLEMSKHLAVAHRAHARGVQLINCQPMREWRTVATRLQCAIPRFRAENARLRSLDPRDIKAFRHRQVWNSRSPHTNRRRKWRPNLRHT